MATDKSFAEQLIVGLTDVRVYPMMGDYVLYCKEKPVGAICDNRLYVKITPESERFLGGAKEVPPYPGAKPRYLVENAEKAFLEKLLPAVADGLPAPKPKRR